MRKRNLMRLAAVLTAGVMMATGCSNGASAPTEGTTAESTEAETTEAESTEAESAQAEDAESAEGEETDSASDEAQGDGPLVIADQGIFSAGGITVTSEGTFNPEDHWRRPAQARLPMWIMPMCFIRFRRTRRGFPWYSFTATDSPVWAG